MDIIATLTARIEEYRKSTRQPCKNYATREGALKAGNEMAERAGKYFTNPTSAARPARFVVFYVEPWGRWVACIDLSELLQRKTSTGGYLGYCKGFYTY